MFGPDDGPGFALEPPLIEEVRQAMGGRPRAFPSGMARDTLGHDLFARVATLPGYGIARAESELLRTRRDEIFALANDPAEVVDLQAGDAVPARPLLGRTLRYVAVERRSDVLDDAMAGLRTAFPRLDVWGIVGEGAPSLAALPTADGPRLALLLGDALGRLDPTAARLELWQLRAAMRLGDRLLVGVDLMKEPARLRETYDDERGLYAAFVRNAFRRANREVGTDFCDAEWAYVVDVQTDRGRVEIRFEARRDVQVRGGRAGGLWPFRRGEPLIVEHLYKPSEAQVAAIALGAGLRIAGTWVDPARAYGLFLLRS